MIGLKGSPLHRFAKPSSAPPKVPNKTNYNPFDSDDDSDKKPAVRSSTEPSSQRSSHLPNSSLTNPFSGDVDDREREKPSSAFKYAFSYAQRSKYKNDFRDTGGVENQDVEELENYAVYRAEETTQTVNNCLKIAEDIREDATKMLVTLH